MFVAVVTSALRNLGRAGAGSSTGPPYDGPGRRRPLSSSKGAERAACNGT